MANTQTFKTLKLDGEALYLRPWENQRGERYGPPDRDQYEVTLVNLTEESMALSLTPLESVLILLLLFFSVKFSIFFLCRTLQQSIQKNII